MMILAQIRDIYILKNAANTTHAVINFLVFYNIFS